MFTKYLLLIIAALAAVSTASSTISTKKCIAFVDPTPSTSSGTGLLHDHNYYNLPLSSAKYNSRSLVLSMSKSSSDLLRQRIIDEATIKLRNKEKIARNSPASETSQQAMKSEADSSCNEALIGMENEEKFVYYIRKSKRSEINDITDVLMDAFHNNSQPAFDSYIRRYKLNHLKMCIDAIDERDRGLFVACAVPSCQELATISSKSPDFAERPTISNEKEMIVGFCSVDGRTPDPSCKIEFLTPSTLASSVPRPYLSDLGVSPSHRRRGIGQLLVKACEEWTIDRGYSTLYLKVDEKNEGGMRLYLGMGYRRAKLPWSNSGRSGNQFDTAVLLEKKLTQESNCEEKQRKSWLKMSPSLLKRLWKGRSISTQVNCNVSIVDIPTTVLQNKNPPF